MKRLDLIIEYLNNIGEVTFAHQGWEGVERLNKALAAARELRKMEPVAVWELMEDGWDTIADSNWMETLPVGTKLYALGDEK